MRAPVTAPFFIPCIEEYGQSSGMRAGDAIISATSSENNMPLSTGNAKHFKVVKELELKVFKP